MGKAIDTVILRRPMRCGRACRGLGEGGKEAGRVEDGRGKEIDQADV